MGNNNRLNDPLEAGGRCACAKQQVRLLDATSRRIMHSLHD